MLLKLTFLVLSVALLTQFVTSIPANTENQSKLQDEVIEDKGADGANASSITKCTDGLKGANGKNVDTAVRGVDEMRAAHITKRADGTDDSDGKNGFDGAEGVDSTRNLDGMKVVDGAKGLGGQNGADGTSADAKVKGVDSTKNLDGMKVIDGAKGLDGQIGADGTSADVKVKGVDSAKELDGMKVVDEVKGLNGQNGADVDTAISGIDRVDVDTGVNGVGPKGSDGVPYVPMKTAVIFNNRKQLLLLAAVEIYNIGKQYLKEGTTMLKSVIRDAATLEENKKSEKLDNHIDEFRDFLIQVDGTLRDSNIKTTKVYAVSELVGELDDMIGQYNSTEVEDSTADELVVESLLLKYGWRQMENNYLEGYMKFVNKMRPAVEDYIIRIPLVQRKMELRLVGWYEDFRTEEDVKALIRIFNQFYYLFGYTDY